MMKEILKVFFASKEIKGHYISSLFAILYDIILLSIPFFQSPPFLLFYIALHSHEPVLLVAGTPPHLDVLVFVSQVLGDELHSLRRFVRLRCDEQGVRVFRFTPRHLQNRRLLP